MSAQYYCSQAGQFLPCNESLIGKAVQCPLCGGTHDALPADTPAVSAPNGVPPSPAAGSPSSSSVQPGSAQAAGGRQVSKVGIGVAAVLILAGLATWSDRSQRISSIQAIFIGAIFLWRSFSLPFKFWQGLLTFFGAGFVAVGAMQGLFLGRGVAMLVISMLIGIPMLYFGWRKRPVQAAGTGQTGTGN